MIAHFLFKNPRILLLTIGVIFVAGLSSFFLMPRLEDPVLGKRVAVVSTVFPGADSQRVESLVTLPIEERLRGIVEISEVRSNSRSGISNIVLRLSDSVDDVDPIWSLVRDQLSDVEAALPESCLRPDFEVFPLKAFAAIIAVKWHAPKNTNASILRKLAGQLRQRISNLSGTESVQEFGIPNEEYVAEIEPTVLAAMQLSTAAIASQISANSVTHPAGYTRGADSQLLLDLKQPDSIIHRLQDSIIRFGPTGQSVKLAEIARIAKKSVVPASDIALIDGEIAIALGAFFDDRLRVDQWAKKLHQTVADFQHEYASELEVEIIFSQQDYIAKRLGLLLKNLMLGTAAVVLVVLVLMGWRSMIVVSVTLPLASLMVLTGMRFMQIPLHQMSITGLIIALGLLIDNAIVIVEDIRSRIYSGSSTTDAIRRGIRHLAMPLFGSTLTTALAFMPIATLPGPPGEFVGTIAISVILAISSSLLLAMTVVPALLALMRIDSSQRNLLNYGISNRFLAGIYEWSLAVVFRFPVLGMLLGAGLPMFGFWAAGQLPEQFFPPSDRRQIQIEVELPAREPIEMTVSTVQALSATVAASPQIRRVHWFVGRSAPTFFYNVVPRRRGTPFYAQAIVELDEKSQPGETVRLLQQQLADKHAECRVVVRQLEQGPPFDAPIELRLAGPDLQQLQQLGRQLRLTLSQTSNVIHTRSDSEESIPKILLDVNPQELSRAGFNETEIAQLLYTTLEGAPAGKILDGDEELSVKVKMASQDSDRLNRLAALQVASNRRPQIGPEGPLPGSTANTPLAALADFELASDQAALVRINGERTNEIKAYIEAGVLPATVLAEFQSRLAKTDFRLPPGYTLTFGGERAERTEAVQRLVANAGLLFSLMILTLVFSFRSFRSALIIVMVGGLTIGLGPLSLWWFGYPFGFMAIVGTMGLVGVAINDSIVVLAAIRENSITSQGDIQELTKVVFGCTRHIVATTITTIAGFTPLILSGGGFWPPLAITIAGGIAGATFLALYLVPSLHILFHRNWFSFNPKSS